MRIFIAIFGLFIFLGCATSVSAAAYKDIFLGGGTACIAIPGSTGQYKCPTGQVCNTAASPPVCVSATTDFFGIFGVTSGGAGTDAEKYGPIRFWANAINTLLGLLGMFTVIVIIYGGFKLMTAGGEADKAKSATKTIYYAVLGLVVIALAWVIGYVAINSLASLLK